MFQLQLFFLLHCDEWDRVVALLRHKFVTGATLLQLRKSVSWENTPKHQQEPKNIFSRFICQAHFVMSWGMTCTLLKKNKVA